MVPTFQEFQKIIFEFSQKNKRQMPWRPPDLPYLSDHTLDPYPIFISEVMLQQTQVSRVLLKFPQFIHNFPDFSTLSRASLFEILQVWQGMGYNRRAKYLKEVAMIIVSKYAKAFPKDPIILQNLPGIGPATASSIITFIYNQPEIFIETNIRQVFIYHFFSDAESVADSEIYPYVEETLDLTDPREWYYALMDYGSWLKKTVPNPNKKSRHYTKQSKFIGSKRELRGKILRILLKQNGIQAKLFPQAIGESDTNKTLVVLNEMIKEGMVYKQNNRYFIYTK